MWTDAQKVELLGFAVGAIGTAVYLLVLYMKQLAARVRLNTWKIEQETAELRAMAERRKADQPEAIPETGERRATRQLPTDDQPKGEGVRHGV